MLLFKNKKNSGLVWSFSYAENLLNVLIQPNLRCIRYSYEIKLSLKSLEEFLEKWKGRPAITIFASYSNYKGLDYVNLQV